MTLIELTKLRAILLWARGKVFTDSLMDEIVAAQAVIDREINLKTMDPRLTKNTDVKYKDE